MKRIGLLSDTHGKLPEAFFDFFREVDEIWHAGDIGSMEVLSQLESFKPTRAVWGNIDGHELRRAVPGMLHFKVEDCIVVMIHIGGYPGRYTPDAARILRSYRPKLFITGHSHILKVMYDKKYECLHINPGAAGTYGLHTHITMVRFEINGDKIENMDVFEKIRK